MNTRKRIAVGLLWHSVNSGNLGVGALTASQIRILEEVAARQGCTVEFFIIGWHDRFKAYIDGPRIHVVPMNSKKFIDPFDGLYAVVRKCGIICDIGAGDSFSDIYGLKRFFFLCLSKAVVLLARRPLILSPQTIGPFGRWWTRAIARRLMGRCFAVVARDNLSFDLLRKLDPPTQILEATDVAFRLPYDKAPRGPVDKVRVGINISGLLYNGGGGSQFGLKSDYRELAHSLLTYFTGRPECEIHLISHVLGDPEAEGDSDSGTAAQLSKAFPGAVLAPVFSSPSEAKSYISGMDFFCGSRMHACIAAFSSGVPLVPLAYSRKFTGLFGSLGYPYVADCKSETSDEILTKVIAAFNEREGLAPTIRSGMERVEQRLATYEALLETCLTRAVGAGV